MTRSSFASSSSYDSHAQHELSPNYFNPSHQYSVNSTFPPTPEFSPYLPPSSFSYHLSHQSSSADISTSAEASQVYPRPSYSHHSSSTSSGSSYRPSNSPPSLCLPPTALPSQTTTSTTTKSKSTRASKPTKSSRESNRKANHSVIEKRRREKINAAMEDLKFLSSGGFLAMRRTEGGGSLSDEMGEGDGGGSSGAKAEFKLDVLEKTVQYIRTLHAHIESLERGAPSRSALGADPLTDPSSPPLSSSVHSPSSLSSSSRQSTPNVTTRAASSSNLGPVRESLDVSIVPSATVDAATMLLSLASPELRGVVGGGAALEIQEWRL